MIVGLLVLSLIASFRDAGAIFLLITPGAQAVGMGSAYVALADDATASYYNPAAIAFHSSPSISSMNLPLSPGLGRVLMRRWLDYSERNFFENRRIPLEPDWLSTLFPDMKYYYYGLVYPLGAHDAVGVNYIYLSTGEIEGVDPYGNPISRSESYDYSLSFSYANKIAENILGSIVLGTSVKYISSYRASGWLVQRLLRHTFGLDIGLIYTQPFLGVSFGVSIQNIGPKIGTLSSSGPTAPLPSLIRRGISFDSSPIIDTILFRLGFSFSSKNLIRYRYAKDWVTDMVSTPHETWEGKGYEWTCFGIFSYRRGHFCDSLGHRIGETKGYGLNLGLVEFEVADDSDIYEFSTENWRVQVNLHPLELPGRIRKNDMLNLNLAALSSLLMPGGGQFYNGDRLKGIGFFILGTYLSHRYFVRDEEPAGLALGVLYFGSALEACLSAIRR